MTQPSTRACPDGIKKAQEALKNKGWSQNKLAEESGIASSTVNRFFQMKTVKDDNFNKICEKLGFDRNQIACTTQASNQVSKQSMPQNESLSETKSIDELVQTAGDEIQPYIEERCEPPSTEPVTSSLSKERAGSSEPIPISKTVETRKSQEEEGIGYIKTQPFEFEYATIVNFKFSGRGKTYEIQRDRRQAEFFTQYLDNSVTLEMVLIPAGSFKMGSPPSENNRKSNEEPQHTLKMPTFFMSKFAITQEQYEQVMGNNPSELKGMKRPVEQVSWNDAVGFCKVLSQKTGRTYRLPSEAEWEYACRAGTAMPFHFGETITTDLANYNGERTYASGSKGENRQQTTEVGSFSPNAFGLYDMHGNVWEWCEDTWHDNYIGAPTDGSPWINNNDTRYLLRGGSWFDSPDVCRSANRHQDPAGHVNNRYGFRVLYHATQ